MPIFDKKLIIQLSVAILFIVFLFSARVFFGGAEDAWICADGNWIRHGNPSAPKPETPCGIREEEIKKEESVLLPRSGELAREVQYCKNRGGKVEYRKNGVNEEYAVCVFPFGRECEANAYLNEECPSQGALITGQATLPARYCITMGGEYRPTRDKNYRTPKETGNCVFISSSGKTCKALDFWLGKCQKEIPVISPVSRTIPATSTINDDIRSVPFLGTLTSDDPLIKTYGGNPEEVFRRQPTVLTLLRRFISNFETSAMGQGFGTVVATLPDKRKFVVFSGCGFDGCVGTLKVAAYDTKKRTLSLLTENDSRSEISLYGVSDEGVRSILLHVYFSLW